MPSRVLALDHMVDFLAEEDEYWRRTVNDPRLWNEKKSEHDASQERHKRKRMMLKHYIDPKANLLLQVDVDKTMEVDGIASPCPTTIPSPSLLASPISLPSTTTTKPEKKRRRTRKSLLPHEICPTCNESKRHQECSLRLCKYCCCASTEKCSLTDHNRSKVGARKPFADITNARSDPQLAVPDVVERMEAAIKSKSSVFIQYDATIQPREIRPRRCEKKNKGVLVHALCVKKNEERSFYDHKIKRFENYGWTKKDAVAGILFHYSLFNLLFSYSHLYFSTTASKASNIRRVAGITSSPSISRQLY